MLKEERKWMAQGKKWASVQDTNTEFCLVSRGIGSKHYLNPNNITNLLWMQVSSNTLTAYTEGQNNFPLEAFSGDNLSNALSGLWVTLAFHKEKWARSSRARLANSKQVDTEACHRFRKTGDMFVLSLFCFSITCLHETIVDSNCELQFYTKWASCDMTEKKKF